MSRFLFFVAFLSYSLLINCSEEINENYYPQKMREFVERISTYSKDINIDFIIIPQNGQELLTIDLEENGSPVYSYIDAIDGVGREDLFYGYEEDDVATPKADLDYMMSYLNIAKSNGVTVLVTDYCFSHSKMDDSYIKNYNFGYLSFSAESRDLDKVQSYPALPYNVNNEDVYNLSEAKNFLYLLSPDDNYPTKSIYLDTLKTTDHDILIIDAFYKEEILLKEDVESLKTKATGGKRLVISYMSIGEAEDYRFYWKDDWDKNKPSWIAGENPVWPGNYKVKYWDSRWQSIILGNEDSYLDLIISTGFDGVYLDIIDAFEYFQNQGKWWIQY